MTLAELSAAADALSRSDAYDRVALIQAEAEAASLFRSASASGDADLVQALTEAAVWSGWDLEPSNLDDFGSEH
jgi:hypothetical protein